MCCSRPGRLRVAHLRHVQKDGQHKCFASASEPSQSSWVVISVGLHNCRPYGTTAVRMCSAPVAHSQGGSSLRAQDILLPHCSILLFNPYVSVNFCSIGQNLCPPVDRHCRSSGKYAHLLLLTIPLRLLHSLICILIVKS